MADRDARAAQVVSLYKLVQGNNEENWRYYIPLNHSPDNVEGFRERKLTVFALSLPLTRAAPVAALHSYRSEHSACLVVRACIFQCDIQEAVRHRVERRGEVYVGDDTFLVALDILVVDDAEQGNVVTATSVAPEAGLSLREEPVRLGHQPVKNTHA